MLRRLILALLFTITASAACGRSPSTETHHEAASPEVGYRLATQISTAASRLDIDAVTRLIPKTDRVVYVSNGYPITGTEYKEEIGNFYRSLKRLDWKWDKWEAVPVSENAVIFTGWASVDLVPLEGKPRTERAIYTFTFVRGNDGWKRVLGHKTMLPED